MASSSLSADRSPGNKPANEPHRPSQQVSLKEWIGVMATLLGAFMAVLDIQITNASLPDISGAIGATLDEGSWISTGYLVAEIVVIPLTGWLSRVFSVRWYLIVNTILFIFFSIACAFAQNLAMMVLFRAGQGFSGGVLIPMSFTTILTTLPPKHQPLGLSLFAVTATFAPSIGPTIGGWLTDSYSWQYIFYINLFPGLLLLAGVWYAITPKPLQLNLLKQGDWWGIPAMAIGLASLEYVLEEGQRKDWFGNELILRFSIIAVIAIPLFVLIEFRRKQPLLNLRLLVRRNFGLSIVMTLALGMGLYGSVYILPLYLSEIQGYNATQIGETIAWSGIPQLFINPLVPRLMRRFDLRILAAVGLSLFGASCLMNSTMTHETGMPQLIPAQIVRALGQPLVMTPLSSIATAGIEKENAGSASSLYNMARNLGGSIGIAALSTLETWREQFHSERLGESISLYIPQTVQRLNSMQQYFLQRGATSTLAYNEALKQTANRVRRESYVMAFNDCFYFMGCVLLLAAFLVVFVKKVKPTSGAVGH